MKTIRVMLFVLFFPFVGHAKIELPSIIADNMVLQQQSNVKLWGKAAPNRKVKIIPSWSNKVYEVSSDSFGKWLINIFTPKAGGPYSIRISDGDEVVLENILIGEVWLCSGQSNMEMPMRGFEYEAVEGAVDLIAKAKESTAIRIYSSDFDEQGAIRQSSIKPLDDCKGQWMVNSSENVARSSAVAYFFARYLQEVLDIPVGIVVASWGGSSVEAWMSEEAIQPFGVDLSHLSQSDKLSKPIQQKACMLYNSKIAPLTKFCIKGMIWYQGESNRYNYKQYSNMLPAMIKDYRERWGIGNFPFYYVEIAPYNYNESDGRSAARFREMQLGLMEKIPNSGMAVTIDLGDYNFIHPRYKEDVGKRLAYWALAKDYAKKNIGYRTPVFRSQEIVGNKIYIDFDNAQGKIHPIGKSLSSFEIAGEDRVFYNADAIIDVKTKRLVVWSEQVSKPVAVRYAYKDYTEASMFDFYRLPVAPFRTDNW
ncbi:MAG: sialate O-acetylesterase [Bacteroides xylanisolvens]|nr:MAG: sialate O-acetylesterase [Bacteroides xylanisolvens]